MGSAHFLMKRLPNVKTEMSLHVLAYNLKRAMQIFGVQPLINAIAA
jgi:transposase